MTGPGRDLRDLLASEGRRHTRLVHQGFFAQPENWAALAASAPPLVPFRGTYHSGLWIADWDHRLPSRNLILRLYAFCTDVAERAAHLALERREAEIAREDRFPEFDVPDYAGLPADEAYEAELSSTGTLGPMRLVSDWRRNIEPPRARLAVDVVRRSMSFQELRRSLKRRAPGLGDLEAAEWSPPCETGHGRWGIDVWYLLNFNGVVGEGRAFLVDVESKELVRERDFQFRNG